MLISLHGALLSFIDDAPPHTPHPFTHTHTHIYTNHFKNNNNNNNNYTMLASSSNAPSIIRCRLRRDRSSVWYARPPVKRSSAVARPTAGACCSPCPVVQWGVWMDGRVCVMEGWMEKCAMDGWMDGWMGGIGEGVMMARDTRVLTNRTCCKATAGENV
jgi:hypothetical protein